MVDLLTVLVPVGGYFVYKAATDPKKKALYKINNNLALAVLSRLPTKMLDKMLVGDRLN